MKSPEARRVGRLEVLHEDEHVCVIVKPCGLLSCPHPGSRARTAQDALEQLLRRRGALSRNHRPLIVHRLDRDTSGVMMFALTGHAQELIMRQWHSMVTERLYRAVAENPAGGTELPDKGLIDDALSFNKHHRGFVPAEKRHKLVPARTHFSVVLRGKTHTLFELSLDTGKKNQIRAHLANRGYPLCGDKNYRARTDRFRRLCLHARTLSFVHPFTKEELSFCVPEPHEWLAYVAAGDPNPELPPWSEGGADKEPALRRRASAKEKARLGFIELGQKRR